MHRLVCPSFSAFEGYSKKLIRLAEIDENLIRNELTELDEALHLAERKEIYETLHPETKTGGAPGAGKGKGKSVYKDCTVQSFQTDTAKKVGKTSRTVERKTRIGSKLRGVAESLRGTAVEDSQKDLLALAKVDTVFVFAVSAEKETSGTVAPN